MKHDSYLTHFTPIAYRNNSRHDRQFGTRKSTSYLKRVCLCSVKKANTYLTGIKQYLLYASSSINSLAFRKFEQRPQIPLRLSKSVSLLVKAYLVFKIFIQDHPLKLKKQYNE